MDRIFHKRWLPIIGPLLLLALWQLMISAHWVKAVLLPPPVDTLAHMAGVFASGDIFADLWATIFRTVCSFGIAVAIGVPLGVMLGSSEGAYRSVEFLIDFFRSTPSSALKTRVMAAQIMGVSKWHVFKDVLLMESLAQTFVGLRSAVSMALVIVIVAEMFIGSETGLGHRIIDAQQVFNVKEMYTSILVTGALGYLLNLLFLLIEKRLVHWSGKA
jgi:ABC-type nitrate/sulfonate/bicarbonate transport system permease component